MFHGNISVRFNERRLEMNTQEFIYFEDAIKKLKTRLTTAEGNINKVAIKNIDGKDVGNYKINTVQTVKTTPNRTLSSTWTLTDNIYSTLNGYSIVYMGYPDGVFTIIATSSNNNLTITSNATFKVLQNVKKTPLFASENNNLRTPENASITTKNGSFEPLILNGAPDGIRTHAYRNHNPRS